MQFREMLPRTEGADAEILHHGLRGRDGRFELALILGSKKTSASIQLRTDPDKFVVMTRAREP